MLALSSRRAEACHTGYQITRAMFVGAALLVDTPLIIYDVSVDRASRGYGIAEAAVTAPQILLASSFIAEGRKDCEDGTGTLNDQSGGAGYSPIVLGVSAALFVHAVYVIVRPGPSAPATQSASTKIGIVPVVVTDREQVPGVTLGVTF
jgi:hypothetical protein